VPHLVSLRRRLAGAGLDALVARLPENLVVATGYAPLVGVSFLYLPRDGEAVLAVPEVEAPLAPPGVTVRAYPYGRVADPPALTSVRRFLEAVRPAPRRVGWEGDFEAVAPAHVAGEVLVPAGSTRSLLAEAWPGAELVDATALWVAERAVKAPEDLDGVRRACRAAEAGVRAFLEAVRPGATEVELVARVEAAVLGTVGEGGVRSARGYAQVLAGPRTQDAWGPAYLATRRPIEPGDLVLLELGTYCDGYWSDLTRVAVAGEPSDRQRELLHAVAEAQEAARRAAVPGASGREVDAAARQALARFGLAEAFPHHTGHGIGFRYHEPVPSLHPASPHTLAEGMVCTIEPGVYGPGWGARLEDVAVVGPADGAAWLSADGQGTSATVAGGRLTW